MQILRPALFVLVLACATLVFALVLGAAEAAIVDAAVKGLFQ